MTASMTGVELIAAERDRQISHEGWTPDHDDKHTDESLAMAAALYAAPELLYSIRNYTDASVVFTVRNPWPWDKCQDKRYDHPRKRCLEIAGALIAAELDRIERKKSREKLLA